MSAVFAVRTESFYQLLFKQPITRLIKNCLFISDVIGDGLPFGGPFFLFHFLLLHS
jgi:hypothetical protein